MPGAARLGGIDAIAAHIGYLKQQNRNSVIVSAGDLVGASPLLSAWFHDEPTIELANRLPLDFNAIGNHEFDEGHAELIRLQRGGCHLQDAAHSCQGGSAGAPVPFEGARFTLLGANVHDALGRRPFPAYGIKMIEGVKVGFIGATLRDTGQLLAPAVAQELRFDDEAAAINALVSELRVQGVATIVLLIHQGGRQVRGPEFDVDGCAGGLADSPIRRIVAQLDGAIDVVISGHTHAAYICRLPNAAGRDVLVTSAGEYGRLLTVLDLEVVRKSGALLRSSAHNMPVERDFVAAPRNAAVDTLLAGYQAMVAPLQDRHAGFIAHAVSARRNAACEMDAGLLAADAQALATQRVPSGAANFALVNPGGVRAPGLVAAGGDGGPVTLGDLFTMQPFGNALVTLTLSGYDIEQLLEQQFAGCYGQTSTRVLQPSAGFSFRWDASRPPCSRIAKITLRGIEIDPKEHYRVAVNEFLAAGGDGFTVLQRGTRPLRGPRELAALGDYLALHDLSRGGLPYDAAALTVRKPRILRSDGGQTCD